MTRRLLKYTLPPSGTCTIVLPVGTVVRAVGMQCRAVQMWVEAPITPEKEARTFLTFYTGDNIEEEVLTYIGTAQYDDGRIGSSLVAHVYELTK